MSTWGHPEYMFYFVIKCHIMVYISLFGIQIHYNLSSLPPLISHNNFKIWQTVLFVVTVVIIHTCIFFNVIDNTGSSKIEGLPNFL